MTSRPPSVGSVHVAPSPPTPTSEPDDDDVAQRPAEFRHAVQGLCAVVPRAEISIGPLRAPRRLAPNSYALGAEVDGSDCLGRLVLLHDPDGHEAWRGTVRLVLYVQADVDEAVAADSLLPEVAWSWLTDALTSSGAEFASLGGTVTATSSVRFGDIASPRRTQQVELRASWTVNDGAVHAPAAGEVSAEQVVPHAIAFCTVLAEAAGLPPVGVRGLSAHRGS